MLNNLQTTFSFDETGPIGAQLPAQGYKGFASFHKYWGKKPVEAWQFLIETLTGADGIVLDPFMGSALIAKECVAHNRRFIGFDVNPISVELAKLYLDPPNYIDLGGAVHALENSVKPLINSMYLLSDGTLATHLLWEQHQITQVWTKRRGKRIVLNPVKGELERFQNAKRYEPRKVRELRLFDNSRINSRESLMLADLFTPRALRAIDLLKTEIAQYSGNLKRALLLILSAAVGQMSTMVFAVTRRGKTKGVETSGIEVGSWSVGYWRPGQHFEVNAWNCYATKADKLLKAVGEAGIPKPVTMSSTVTKFLHREDEVYVQKGDSEECLKDIPSGTVNVVLTDPPHGDRIPYLELSEMWNSIIGLEANYAEELVVSNAKARGKDVNAYNRKLAAILRQCARVLKNNGVLAIIFNARSVSHWDSLRELESGLRLEYLGCYPLVYSAGSILQDNRSGGLRTDFVLLYGKRMSEEFRNRTRDTFCRVAGWTLSYPRELC